MSRREFLANRGASSSGVKQASRSSDTLSIVRAWENFATGETAVQGVRPEILESWYRCRDRYEVDPALTSAPRATDHLDHRLDHDVVFTELGGLGALAGREVQMDGGIVTISDGTGRVLASWGDSSARRRAGEYNLAPWSDWAEQTTGTNGMGTALETRGPVIVTGAEHWCAGFHQWACAGIAIREVVTGTPIASINISRWGGELSDKVVPWLSKSAAAVEADMRLRAVGEGHEVVTTFREVSSKARSPIAGLDIGGGVVVANAAAVELLGLESGGPMLDPADRGTPKVSKLSEVVRWAASQARKHPNWTGSAQLEVASGTTTIPVSIRAVFETNRLVGLLCDFDSQEGEPYESGADSIAESGPRRVIGMRNDRLIVLTPSEIRYAEADRNTVWLTTDRGKLQASTRGLDNVERALRPHGFFRTHRRFLVNLRRVTELERGIKGELLLITDPRAPEFIPVSRRHAPEIRQLFGI